MRRVYLSLVVLLCLAAGPVAWAHCEECPFPLAKILGRWQSKQGISFITRAVRQSALMLEVDLTILAPTSGIVAHGRAVLPKSNTSVEFDLQYRDGTQHHYTAHVDHASGELIIEGLAEASGPGCGMQNAVCRSLRLRPVAN